MATAHQKAAQYTCPMHPEVTQDHPGTCPKCGMALVPNEPGAEGAAKQVGEHEEHEARSAGDHQEMVRQMRAPWLWTNFTVIALGLWLTTSPFTFGYMRSDLSGFVNQVTEERGLAPVETRGAVMAWNDGLSGILLALFATLALWPYPRTDFWGRWGVCAVGIWLQFAPLLLWSPSPAAYINDTLIGALAIGLSVLVPMMPGRRPLRARHHSCPHLPRLAAAALTAQHVARNDREAEGRSSPLVSNQQAEAAVFAGATGSGFHSIRKERFMATVQKD
jgi:hypothetical protein